MAAYYRSQRETLAVIFGICTLGSIAVVVGALVIASMLM
jgi:hypothetical protein